MILFDKRPDFRIAWEQTKYRVVMAGMGDDTVMMIAELFKLGLEPDEIVFCDTGSEFQHTYRFIEYLKTWCAFMNWSKVTVLQKKDKDGNPLSLIDNVEAASTLPAAAFGSKSCSLRFKVETADLYFNNNPQCWEAWGVDSKGRPHDTHTGTILRMIGINDHEHQRTNGWKPEHKWCQVYPLVDLGIGERESDVASVGLYYPGKSSCICCPHMNGKELYELKTVYPADYVRIKRMEARYIATQWDIDSSTRGLCREKTIDEKIKEYTKDGIIRGEGGCDTCTLQ